MIKLENYSKKISELAIGYMEGHFKDLTVDCIKTVNKENKTNVLCIINDDKSITFKFIESDEEFIEITELDLNKVILGYFKIGSDFTLNFRDIILSSLCEIEKDLEVSKGLAHVPKCFLPSNSKSVNERLEDNIERLNCLYSSIHNGLNVDVVNEVLGNK